jgi:two-component system, cell cycle sensor histidine kinase and response regulator CckA
MALEAALVELRQAGIGPHRGPGEPWLELNGPGQHVALSPGEAALRAPPGSELDAELHAGVAALLRVSLARAAEHRELLAVRERLALLSSASFEGIIVHVDGKVVDVNSRLLEMLGCERSDLIGPGVDSSWFVTPEDLARVRQRVRDRIEGPCLATIIRKDGSRFLAEAQATQGTFGERPVRMVALRDVTERERSAALLGESETRLRELAEAAFDYIVFSRDGVIVEVTGRVDEVLGYRRDEMVGHSVMSFVAPQSMARAREILTQRLLGAVEAFGLAKSGEHVPVAALVVETTLRGQPVRMAAIRDLRETHRLEAERRKHDELRQRSQRLESLGVLAGGIAHDFNNLLTGVLGNAGLLAEALVEPQDLELCSAIGEAAQRAADLTAQLLAYAGRRELGPRRPLDVSSLWREIGALLGSRLAAATRIEQRLAADCVVLGDRATLTQVFMNLLTNAADACGPTGTITVRTHRLAHPDARWQTALGARVGEGDWVMVEVEDDGAGMSPETLERIFEPFFTTKARGHGLGLASCLGIVSAHGGALLVESEPARGTTFFVLLPAARAIVTETPASPAVLEPRQRCILVIDDEPTVRAFLCRSLARRGFSLREAGGGSEGLRVLADAKPDLIVLDLGMPDLDGAEVLRRLRADGLSIPVIIASGHVDSATEHRLAPGSFQEFLRKPFSPAELFAAVDKVLRA